MDYPTVFIIITNYIRRKTNPIFIALNFKICRRKKCRRFWKLIINIFFCFRVSVFIIPTPITNPSRCRRIVIIIKLFLFSACITYINFYHLEFFIFRRALGEIIANIIYGIIGIISKRKTQIYNARNFIFNCSCHASRIERALCAVASPRFFNYKTFIFVAAR